MSVNLAANAAGDYNWITPEQYNDRHAALTGGFLGLIRCDSARRRR
jgi:phosphatidylinositol-3-phosphatase